MADFVINKIENRLNVECNSEMPIMDLEKILRTDGVSFRKFGLKKIECVVTPQSVNAINSIFSTSLTYVQCLETDGEDIFADHLAEGRI